MTLVLPIFKDIEGSRASRIFSEFFVFNLKTKFLDVFRNEEK